MPTITMLHALGACAECSMASYKFPLHAVLGTMQSEIEEGFCSGKMSGTESLPQDPSVTVCSPKEDEGARQLIDQLTRSEGNDVCADCGDRSE